MEASAGMTEPIGVVYGKRGRCLIGRYLLAMLCCATSLAFAAPARAPLLVEAARTVQTGDIDYHYISGQEVRIPYVVVGSSQERVDLRAQLLQKTNALLAPIGGAVEVLANADLHTNSKRTHYVTLTLPRVKRESVFELRYFFRLGSQPAWHPAGRITLRVYPQQLLAPLRRWAEHNVLQLRDNDGKLTQFLHAHHIPFVERSVRMGGHVPSSRTPEELMLIVGAEQWQRRAESRHQRKRTIIVFKEQLKTVPHVVVQRSERHHVIFVEMKLLDQLAVRPELQKTFLDIMTLSLTQTTLGAEE